jgi:hypothetical protein
MPVDSDIKKCIKKNRENMRAVKPIDLFGIQLLNYLTLHLPFNLAEKLYNILSKKITLSFSSAPAAKVGYQWGDYRATSAISFLPSISEMAVGITCISLENIL